MANYLSKFFPKT